MAIMAEWLYSRRVALTRYKWVEKALPKKVTFDDRDGQHVPWNIS